VQGDEAAALRDLLNTYTPAPIPVGGDVVGLLNAILDAQNAQPYRGWNITKLNKAVDAAREHLGLPSIRELNPDIAAMQDHARANKDAIQSALQAQPAPAQGDDVVESNGLPQDVVGLVIAARELVFSDHRPVGSPETQAEIELIELFDNLDTATEKFSEMVRWDDEPDCDPIDDSETPSDDQQPTAQLSDLVERVSALFKQHHRNVCYPECSDGEAEIFARAALAAMQGGDAVLAERERCAKIAEAIPTDWRDGTQPGPLSAYRHACREIAAAIRGGA